MLRFSGGGFHIATSKSHINNLSRARKQRFPRNERKRTPIGDNSFKDDDLFLDEEQAFPHQTPKRVAVHRQETPPISISRPSCKSKKDCDERPSQHNFPRLDKRARDEHNEQERSRRRELAVIYELIRSSFTQEDLKHLEPGTAPKSIDKLSYPQVLQVAYGIMLEEHHNIKIFEKTLNDIRVLEKELTKQGINVPPRPNCPSLTENYRRVILTVESILKTDKHARNLSGIYEMAPFDRAQYGDQQLGFVKHRHQHSLSENFELLPPNDKRPVNIPQAKRNSNPNHSSLLARYSSLNAYPSSGPGTNNIKCNFNSAVSMPRNIANTNSDTSQNSRHSGSVASLDDLEELDLYSICADAYDLFQNPLDHTIGDLELDPIDARFELLGDI